MKSEASIGRSDPEKWGAAQKSLLGTLLADLSIAELGERVGCHWVYRFGGRKIRDILSLSFAELQSRWVSSAKITDLVEIVSRAAEERQTTSIDHREPENGKEPARPEMGASVEMQGGVRPHEGVSSDPSGVRCEGKESRAAEKPGSVKERIAALPPGGILGECITLSEDDYRALVGDLADRIRAAEFAHHLTRGWITDYASLAHGIAALSPLDVLMAAVFFVRYDYSYEHDGFWHPFLANLGVEATQGHSMAFRKQFDRAFRQLNLYRPTGGYRYVSPLIYHSILPNDGIGRFAEIIAHEDDMWSYWASADTGEVVDFLRTRHVSTNMKRLLEHDGELVAGLFCDVCDYLATGRPTSTSTCGLDVEAIASAARDRQATGKLIDEESRRRGGDAGKWYVPRPSWVWQRADRRVGIRIPAVRLAGESGEYVRATIRAGQREEPLDVDLESRRTSPLVIDCWHVDMGAAGVTLELLINGQSVASKTLPMLDRTCPIAEINGALVSMRSSLAIPARARWLLPDGTIPGDAVTQVTAEVAPYPLNGWSVGLFDATEAPCWLFRREGIDKQEYSCEIEAQPSWMLQTDRAIPAVKVEDFDGPVFTDWPEIEFVGEKCSGELICEVRNLSSDESHSYRLADLLAQGEQGFSPISHRDLVCDFAEPCGCFTVKLKTPSFRSISSAHTVQYCFFPLCELRLPPIIWPGNETLQLQAELSPLLARMAVKPSGALDVKREDRQLIAEWSVGTEMAIMVETPIPFRLQFPIPRIGWGVDTQPGSECLTLAQGATREAGRQLVVTTDAAQPAQLVAGDWVMRRLDGVSHWVVPLTAFYEPVEKSTNRVVSIHLEHAGGSWEVLRFRRNLHVTSIVCQQYESAFYVRAGLSAETEERLFAVAALPGAVGTTVRAVELDPAGENGSLVDVDGVAYGEWHVVFRLCPGGDPKRGELLPNDAGAPALLRIPLRADPNDLAEDSIEANPVEELLNCAEWELPLSLFHGQISQSTKDALRDGILGALTSKPEDEARRQMGHIFREGINFASFPSLAANRLTRVAEAEKLASLWQPLAVPLCASPRGEWSEGILGFLGCPHGHALFLPVGTLVECDGRSFVVEGVRQPCVVEDTTYDRFPVRNAADMKEHHYLVLGNCDHTGAVLDEDDIAMFEPGDLLPFRRSRTVAEKLPQVLDTNLVPLMQAIWKRSLPQPLVPMVFACANGQQPAFSPEFLLKGYWHWVHGTAGTKEFREYWGQTRSDCAGVYPWLRVHLGDWRDGDPGKPLFRDSLTRQCAAILIELTRQIEVALPFHQDSREFAYPGFLFILAVYNRLAGRHPDRIPGIRPHLLGQEWLCKHSSVAFRNARLMFNYWLILVEAVLNWWNVNIEQKVRK